MDRVDPFKTNNNGTSNTNNGSTAQNNGKKGVDEDGKVAFVCGADSIVSTPLRKLSRRQMGFILSDVLSGYALDELASQSVVELQRLMPRDTPIPISRELPTQTGELGFRRLDQNVDQLHIDALLESMLY